ncbi:recombinase family protein [Actinokineospora baliensis]|uniref:recombinase family protein n=1 Tax=Actinokineospora baliensis TaxID=547056 RepID=UPI001956E8B1|nr:recombinase family protein [Actinokineospora baliensis]
MTLEISRDPWSTLDDLMGIEVTDLVDDGIGDLAFYGRCSTEDNQDPDTSHGWQHGNANKFIGPLGGRIVADFFDIGQSRSVPWERREEGSRLLAALKDPGRTWTGVVVGEGTRCWFGNQFSLIAPRFEAYGVDLWVPELGGKYDSRNPSHKMLMSVLGGMSESERQHVQARVRAAMDAQVVNEGRHQGGRAPYGYVTVNGGVHPNPRKAAEGFHLRVLVIDEPAAEVVRRIFAAYLDGNGDRAIANALNRDGVPCPSAARPEQNRHRLADGWQASAVRSILENPRYTGYAVFGRWVKQEVLADPDDVAAGHVTKFRRASPDRIVRSRTQAHPAIVSVETFTEVQLLRRSKGAGGLESRAKLERGPKATKRVYALRGRVRCGHCERRMEGTPRENRIYYRCAARSIVPGSPILATHPKNIYLPENAVLPHLNDWISGLLAPKNRDTTVAALVGAQPGTTTNTRTEPLRHRIKDAETRLRRLQAAIEAGANPTALVDALNRAEAERDAARIELDALPAGRAASAAEVDSMIDYLDTIGRQVNDASPARLQELYTALDLELFYNAEDRMLDVSIRSGRGSKRVRGGT